MLGDNNIPVIAGKDSGDRAKVLPPNNASTGSANGSTEGNNGGAGGANLGGSSADEFTPKHSPFEVFSTGAAESTKSLSAKNDLKQNEKGEWVSETIEAPTDAPPDEAAEEGHWEERRWTEEQEEEAGTDPAGNWDPENNVLHVWVPKDRDDDDDDDHREEGPHGSISIRPQPPVQGPIIPITTPQPGQQWPVSQVLPVYNPWLLTNPRNSVNPLLYWTRAQQNARDILARQLLDATQEYNEKAEENDGTADVTSKYYTPMGEPVNMQKVRACSDMALNMLGRSTITTQDAVEISSAYNQLNLDEKASLGTLMNVIQMIAAKADEEFYRKGNRTSVINLSNQADDDKPKASPFTLA